MFNTIGLVGAAKPFRSPHQRRWVIAAVLLLCTGLAGCRRDGGESPRVVGDVPRGVSVFTVKASMPSSKTRLTGSAEAWKSEEIGFEVPGRVSWVIEPNEDIEGRLPGTMRSAGALRSDGALASAGALASDGNAASTESFSLPGGQRGTVIAKLDDERYRLAVASARATVNRFTRDKEALAAEISDSIPAQVEAAKANIELAELEFNRLQSLIDQNAASRSEFDRARADRTNAQSELSKLQASSKVKQAQLLAIDAQIAQAEAQVAEAERDLRDCWLYSSFRGQVAKVHVVPGSIVGQGTKVATVQLMDPMKIELEVSASVSRRLKIRDTIHVSSLSGLQQGVEQPALIYTVDAVADPQTRTFTVTLLCRNGKVPTPVPPELENTSIARTERIFPLNTDFVDGKMDWMLAEVRTIHHDDEGDHVWRITNRRFGEVSLGLNAVLEVEKVRVKRGEQTIPFLGNWELTPITVVGDDTLDPEQDLLAGQVTVSGSESASWNGHSVLFNHDEWNLRPGDLLNIDLSSKASEAGLHVPVRAIRHESSHTFVFLIVEDGQTQRAEKTKVRLVDGDSAHENGQRLQQIEPLDEVTLEGRQVIVGGVHYIEDGESVRVVETWDDNR